MSCHCHVVLTTQPVYLWLLTRPENSLIPSSNPIKAQTTIWIGEHKVNVDDVAFYVLLCVSPLKPHRPFNTREVSEGNSWNESFSVSFITLDEILFYAARHTLTHCLRWDLCGNINRCLGFAAFFTQFHPFFASKPYLKDLIRILLFFQL